MENLKRLNTGDQVKFVIGDRIDYGFAKKTMELIPPKLPANHILFSPVYGKMAPDDGLEYEDYESYDADFTTGALFGCIHFKPEELC